MNNVWNELRYDRFGSQFVKQMGDKASSRDFKYFKTHFLDPNWKGSHF